MKIADLEPGKIYAVRRYGAAMFVRLVRSQQPGVATKAEFANREGRSRGTFGGQQVNGDGPLAATWEEWDEIQLRARAEWDRERAERSAKGQRAEELAAQLRGLLDCKDDDVRESLGHVRIDLTNDQAEALIKVLNTDTDKVQS